MTPLEVKLEREMLRLDGDIVWKILLHLLLHFQLFSRVISDRGGNGGNISEAGEDAGMERKDVR